MYCLKGEHEIELITQIYLQKYVSVFFLIKKK